MSTVDSEPDDCRIGVAVCLPRSIHFFGDVRPVGGYAAALAAVWYWLVLDDLHIVGLSVFSRIYSFLAWAMAVARSRRDHSPLPCTTSLKSVPWRWGITSTTSRTAVVHRPTRSSAAGCPGA